MSIDLSHIGLDPPGEAVQRRLQRIAAVLPEGGTIQAGAEEERRADRILATVLAVARTGGAVSATIQANLKRSRSDAHALAEGGVPIRLVKGAYVEDPRVARPWGESTDLAFLELAHELHAAARRSHSPHTTRFCARRSCVLYRMSGSKCCLACAALTRAPSPAAPKVPSGHRARRLVGTGPPMPRTHVPPSVSG